MGDRSAIEWTDATWNPATGCTKISAGCDNCYAERLANGRLYDRYTDRAPANPRADDTDGFAVRLWPERMDQPSRWRKPRMIFVNSMSDLFHVDIPDDFIHAVFDQMMEHPRHVYQVLTKRPGRMRRWWMMHRHYYRLIEVPEHIWIGTSIENGVPAVAMREVHLARIPAKTRFLSLEPLIGPFVPAMPGEIDWVIVGGESGPGARRMSPEWARHVRDWCRHHDVPFFFKQWGGRTPKAGGRELDGCTHDDMPIRRLPGDA